MAFRKVFLPPIDRHFVFHPANLLNTFSSTLSQIDTERLLAPSGGTKYVVGKESTYTPKSLPNDPTLPPLPLCKAWIFED